MSVFDDSEDMYAIGWMSDGDDGYDVGPCRPRQKPNAVYCPVCGVAVAEVWKPKGRGYSVDTPWSWCTRTEGPGRATGRHAALWDARQAVLRGPKTCECD